MSEAAELATVLEGDGSRPLLSGGVSARGMLNLATSPTALVRGRLIESAENVLYVTADALPALAAGDTIVIGAIDAEETAAGDRSYVAQDRVPQDDGLLHAIRLDQGVVL